MEEKMTNKDHEKDMIIIHNEAIVEFDNHIEKRTSTMKQEGRPFGILPCQEPFPFLRPFLQG